MKIQKFEIENFRLLKNTTIDIEENISLILGRNNTGKTSFLTILDKFLNNGNSFVFNDFNLDFQKEITALVEEEDPLKYQEKAISLRIYIEYNDKDNLEKVSSLITNLNPDDNILIISFKYTLDFENYKKLISNFQQFKNKMNIDSIDLIYYLKKNHYRYFKIKKETIDSRNKEITLPIDEKDIKKIINFQFISAKRGVDNQCGNKSSDKTLSKLSSDYYNIIDKPDLQEINNFEKQLIETDEILSKKYKDIFKPVLSNIKTFGADDNKRVELEIKSLLEKKNVLKDNTYVTYKQNGNLLPEDYNGLGYMNLIAILFSIHIKIELFKEVKGESEDAAINLLFIEEPEAHTHPQMQYIFIKNIKKMLEKKEENEKINLQTIITTHSSHIASQSDFEDIKYFFLKEGEIESKNLYDLNKKDKENYQFLKQYLTLNRAEMLFADKIIFIEGDTERILLPAMMKKIDLENNSENYYPLMSQNISIIEVGAYSHKFEKFLDFLEIKTLIITDIDSSKKNETSQKNNSTKEEEKKEEKARVAESSFSTNASIKHYLPDYSKNFEGLKKLEKEDKILKDNKLLIAYQTEENNYHARSFEDSFININKDFINKNKGNFNSLKYKDFFDDKGKDPYELAERCIVKKTLFATEIIYYGGKNFKDWKIPKYIEEGLLWLSEK